MPPMYEYDCRNSECTTNRFTMLQPFEDRGLGRCPQCGSGGAVVEVSEPGAAIVKRGTGAGRHNR